MKPENRMFFQNEKEAIDNGYRPCAHCMRVAYLAWKKKSPAFERVTHLTIKH